MVIKKLIKHLLSEGFNKNILLEELSILIEKEIMVGDSLVKKLNNVNKPYADKLLNFLRSNNISDNFNIDGIDYAENDDKTLTAYVKDRDGNLKGRRYKVGKLFTSLGIKLDDFKGYEIEDLISHLKKGTIEDFKLLSGADILWAYHCDNYDEGETMGSCMRYEAAQSYLKIYTENPDSVKCLTLINPKNGKVRGRALIWHTDSDEFFMDKTYLTNNQYANLFILYAEEHGYKKSTNSTVSLENIEFDEYPFMDTFQFLNKDEKILMTSNDGDESTVKLDDTHGSSNNTGIYIELGSRAGEYVEEDETYYLSYDTPDGYREGYAHGDDVYFYNDGVYLLDDMYEVYDTDGDISYVFKEKDDDDNDDNPVVTLNYGSYSGKYALYDDVVKLYIEFYGDEAYSLNDRYVVSLYSEKYDEDGDVTYALGGDVEELFNVKYGEDKWAFTKDVTSLNFKEHGQRYVLTDDLDDLDDFEVEEIEEPSLYVNESYTNKSLIKEILRKYM